MTILFTGKPAESRGVAASGFRVGSSRDFDPPSPLSSRSHALSWRCGNDGRRTGCQHRNKTTAFPPILLLREGHRRGGGTHSIRASKFFDSAFSAKTPVWSNGGVAIVIGSSNHRSFSR